jgi:inorganic pyrophosphatase
LGRLSPHRTEKDEHTVKHRDLSKLPLEFDDGAIRAVIETPMGSFNKYDYDPTLDVFELKDVLPRGSEFPFDFGFFPSTLGEDGDPVDALVLSDRGLETGIVLQARLIGVIEFEDLKDGKTTRNDRLVVVPTCSVIYAKIKSLEDLPAALVEQIESFFELDAFFKGKKRRFLGRGDAKQADKLLMRGKAAFKKQG